MWYKNRQTADAAPRLCFMCKKSQFLVLSATELQSGNRCCSDLLSVGVATVPQTLKTIPPQCCVLLIMIRDYSSQGSVSAPVFPQPCTRRPSGCPRRYETFTNLTGTEWRSLLSSQTYVSWFDLSCFGNGYLQDRTVSMTDQLIIVFDVLALKTNVANCCGLMNAGLCAFTC